MNAAPTQNAAICLSIKIPIAYFLTTAIVMVSAGCATQSQDESVPRDAYSDTTSANTPLREVYVLGSVRNTYDAPNMKLDPLLNPRTPPPAFKEENNLIARCAPSTKLGLVDDRGSALMDDARFQQLMVLRLHNAQARHTWQFNQQRHEAQLKTVSGPRTMGRNGREVAARPSGTRPGVAPARPDTSTRGAVRDMLNLLKPANGQNRSEPSVAAQLNSHLPDFDKMREDLAYNAQILAAQDEALKTREREYTDQLFALYQDAFRLFREAPQAQISLAALNRFDNFRYKNIFTCALRGESTSTAQGLDQAISNQYDPLAQQIIESNRNLLVQAIKGAQHSSDLQTIYQDMLSTLFLKDLASQNQLISQALQQRSTALLAQEAREREELKKRAEAEAARQAALLQKKYLQNAAKNAPPTVDDVGRLFSAYDAEINEQYRNFRIERTTPESFVYYAQTPLFGELKGGQIETSAIDLSCKPEQGRQRCAFTEKRMITEYHLGLYTETHPGESSGQVHEAVFYWDASGLHSPQLRSDLIERMKKFLARLQAEMEASLQRANASSRKTCTRYFRQFGSQVSSYEECH